MKTRILFLISLVIAISTIQAQERCFTFYDVNKVGPEKHASIEKFYNSVENMLKYPESFSMLTTNFDPQSELVLIPVVVHVVHKSTTENISDAQICSQIEIINEDFARRNADRNLTPGEFVGRAADTEIQFFLATRDPNGNVTNGITRTSTTEPSFTRISNRVKSNSTGGHDPWNTNKYLNLWVCDLAYPGLGYAQFPWDYASSPNTDGVVVDFEAFGNIGTALAPYHLGRTATHEIGHWLGLKHIWGDDHGACTGSDGISDTPNQGGHYGGFCPSGVRASCGSNDMYMNYMDYTDDACMNVYSNGQKAVMRATLNSGGYR